MAICVDFEERVNFEDLEAAMRHAAEELHLDFSLRDDYDRHLAPGSDTLQPLYRGTDVYVSTPFGGIRANLDRESIERRIRLYETIEVTPANAASWESAALDYAKAVRTYLEASLRDRP